MDAEFIANLRKEYTALLEKAIASGEIKNDKTAPEICEMMMEAIRVDANKSDYADWMKHNKRLAMAAKKCGVKTSPDLRDKFKDRDENWKDVVEVG
jgi:hypothetical protein